MGRQDRRRWLRGAAASVAVLGLSAAACGGSDVKPPPNCLQIAPCGGDVVGSWGFLGTCANVAAESADLQAVCPGARLTSSGAAITGSFAFSADGSYTATSWHETFAGSELLPLSCAPVAECADLNQTTTDTSNGMTQTIITTCTGTTTCSCRFRGTFSVTSDFGSWYASGTTLDMFGGSTSGTFSYCVEEDRLHLLGLSSTGRLVSDIVAVRL